jgi:hypothetical protein
MEDLAELSLHSIDYSSAGWKHAKCRQRTSVDNGLAVDQHLEFSVASLDHFDVGSQFATKTRRHPDGVQAGHSIGAIADGNPSHATSSDRVNQSRSARPLSVTIGLGTVLMAFHTGARLAQPALAVAFREVPSLLPADQAIERTVDFRTVGFEARNRRSV